jgi:hypothetical protein
MRAAGGCVLLALAFAGGLAGSLHCLGMCGGLVALVGRGPQTGAAAWRRVGLYNLARVNMLTALGAAAGAAGALVVAWGPLDAAERVLAVVAGIVAVAVGLETLGVLAPRGRWLASRLHRGVGSAVRELLASRSAWVPIAFGTLNAFLPCHLIYAFLAMAAATGSVGRGALTMFAFGLGTVPAMMLAGRTAALLPARMGPRLVRVAGGLVVVVGLVTIARAFGGPPALHVHHH